MNLVRDGIWSLLFKLSWPGILAMVIISLNSFISAVYVGQLVGAEALSGVSLTLPLSVITTSVVALISVGAGSIYSRAIGANNKRTQIDVFYHLIFLSIVFSLLLTIAGYQFAPELLVLMGATGEVKKFGAEFFQITILASVFTVGGATLNTLIRAEGKIKHAITLTFIYAAIQIAVTPLFITLFDLGVKGAAYAFVLSTIIYSLLSLNFFLSGKSNITIEGFSFRLRLVVIKDILKLGVSGMLLQSSNFIRQALIFKSMTLYGSTQELAVMSAVFRIFMFSVVPIFGLLQAMQPIVGVNFGAKEHGRALEAVSAFRIAGVLLLTIFWLPSVVFPEWMLSIMLPEESFPPVSVFNFRLVMFSLPFMPIASTTIVYFQAIGESKISGILSIARQVLFFIPLVLILPRYLGSNGIYYSIAIENIFYAVVVLVGFSIYQKTKQISLQPL